MIMRSSYCVLLGACLLRRVAAAAAGKTVIATRGHQWEINGALSARGTKSEGLLLNARLIQAIFDDSNASTREIFPLNFGAELPTSDAW